MPFSLPPDTAVITCVHILNGAPILHVVHDEDGDWQFLCGKKHTTEEARVISLAEACKLDETVTELSEMPCGVAADRRKKGSKWKIR